MAFKWYHGKTGVVWNVTKRAVGVEVNKTVSDCWGVCSTCCPSVRVLGRAWIAGQVQQSALLEGRQQQQGQPPH
jgi:hypothetical protein